MKQMRFGHLDRVICFRKLDISINKPSRVVQPEQGEKTHVHPSLCMCMEERSIGRRLWLGLDHNLKEVFASIFLDFVRLSQVIGSLRIS